MSDNKYHSRRSVLRKSAAALAATSGVATLGGAASATHGYTIEVRLSSGNEGDFRVWLPSGSLTVENSAASELWQETANARLEVTVSDKWWNPWTDSYGQYEYHPDCSGWRWEDHMTIQQYDSNVTVTINDNKISHDHDGSTESCD